MHARGLTRCFVEPRRLHGHRLGEDRRVCCRDNAGCGPAGPLADRCERGWRDKASPGSCRARRSEARPGSGRLPARLVELPVRANRNGRCNGRARTRRSRSRRPGVVRCRPIMFSLPSRRLRKHRPAGQSTYVDAAQRISSMPSTVVDRSTGSGVAIRRCSPRRPRLPESALFGNSSHSGSASSSVSPSNTSASVATSARRTCSSGRCASVRAPAP